MPPKRRSTGATAGSNQSTLAFHGALNKVTKPNARAQNAKKNLPAENVKKDRKPLVTDVEVGHGDEGEDEDDLTTTEAAIVKQTKQAQQQTQKTPEEDKARKIKKAQIQAYWKSLTTGPSPRFHQQDISMEEQILRKFDMSGQFGPCTGIARLKRWQRAQRLGLKPPIEVLAVLLQEQDAKNKVTLQRSIMDELLNSRTEIDV